jgi:hypothetical protein
VINTSHVKNASLALSGGSNSSHHVSALKQYVNNKMPQPVKIQAKAMNNSITDVLITVIYDTGMKAMIPAKVNH